MTRTHIKQGQGFCVREWGHNEQRWSVKHSKCHGLLQCMPSVTDLPLKLLTWVRGPFAVPMESMESPLATFLSPEPRAHGTQQLLLLKKIGSNRCGSPRFTCVPVGICLFLVVLEGSPCFALSFLTDFWSWCLIVILGSSHI